MCSCSCILCLGEEGGVKPAEIVWHQHCLLRFQINCNRKFYNYYNCNSQLVGILNHTKRVGGSAVMLCDKIKSEPILVNCIPATIYTIYMSLNYFQHNKDIMAILGSVIYAILCANMYIFYQYI